MKKGVVFLLGVLTGAILTFGTLLLFSIGYYFSDDNQVSMFSAPGDVMQLKSFEVFQVLPNGNALAHSSAKPKSQTYGYRDPIVLILADAGCSYYDSQVIEVSSKQVVRQIGIYKYDTIKGFGKTVPIVGFFDLD